MSFVPGDETVADGTMAKAIYDAMIAMFGENEQIDQARKEAAAAMAIGICEHANPRLLSGDVTGPETSTNNAIPRWDGAAGGTIQDSLVTIDDSGNIALASGKTVDGRDVSADGSTLDSHTANTSNPHSVTAAQVGAVPTARTISTTAPLTGGGDLSANRTLGISAASGSAAGSMSASDFTKLAGIASGATNTPLSDSNPAGVSDTASPGAASSASRADHAHTHGSQAGGSLHSAATALAAGFMSAADFAKLAGLNAGPYSPTVAASTGLTGTPTVVYASYHAIPIDGGPLRHVEVTLRISATLSGAGPGRELRVSLPFDRGGNFSAGAEEGSGEIGGSNVTNGRCAPLGSAQTFRPLFDSTGSSGTVSVYARLSYDTVA